MAIRLSVTWEGDAPGIRGQRLSLGAFGLALTNLVAALRRIATNMVDQALDDRQSSIGRFTDDARQLDIEITELIKGSLGVDSLVTIATPAGETLPLFADLPEKATMVLLDAIDAERQGILTNSTVRRYLQSLPNGITQQTYGIYQNGDMLKKVSFGTVEIAKVPTDLPSLAEYFGYVVGVGFEPGAFEVRIKPEGEALTFMATPLQVDTALELRHARVRALAVVHGNARRLLILQEAHVPIYQSSRDVAIFQRWNGLLRRLAQ
jgi:hypothetical protein